MTRTPRPHLIRRSADLASEFGFDWATKLFGAETIASLPVRKSGPNKGRPVGYLIWEKASANGWMPGPGAVREGQLVRARIGLGPFSTEGVVGTWNGRPEALDLAACFLFEEGRARARELVGAA